jgi:hypothetical protein
MSNRPGPDAPRPSKPGAGPPREAPQEDPPQNERRPKREQPGAPLKGLQSLERLRDRVEQAAREISRLREENTMLARRLSEMEARPAVDPEGSPLSFDEDPEVLRRKITGFIEAIDRYLEGEQPPG